jgi:tRNA uridine 5-carbamoylmethylation protein Kti12
MMLEPGQRRPQWTEAVRMFIADEVLDEEKYGYPESGRDDWLHSLIEDAVNNVLCNAYGHSIVDDQCMIPSHRYCVYCGQRASVLYPRSTAYR